MQALTTCVIDSSGSAYSPQTVATTDHPYTKPMNTTSIFRKPFTLDELNALNPGTLLEALGIRITEAGNDFLRGTLPVDGRTRQPFGLLHGGASVALAETLGSLAGWLCRPEDGSTVVGLDINANHLRAMREGLVTGTARALHLGSSTQVWEIRIEDDGGHLLCISRLTLAVVAKR
jgi:1,4-dihydroxy-2-naphthoyl-CoA hydrolase